MPFRFVPLGANASLDEIRATANANFAQLDGELVTKTYKQSGGNAIIEGKLPYDGGYGILIYDSTPTPRILIGIAPDGSIDIAASISGQDITTLYT